MPGLAFAISKYRDLEVQMTLHLIGKRKCSVGWFNDKLLIADCFHMMLDEAYGSISGNQNLSPFTKHQLITQKLRKVMQSTAFNIIFIIQRMNNNNRESLRDFSMEVGHNV